jgi:hypothetical protein
VGFRIVRRQVSCQRASARADRPPMSFLGGPPIGVENMSNFLRGAGHEKTPHSGAGDNPIRKDL